MVTALRPDAVVEPATSRQSIKTGDAGRQRKHKTAFLPAEGVDPDAGKLWNGGGVSTE